jgi:anthranilate/para-aminobenzoate synthase component I
MYMVLPSKKDFSELIKDGKILPIYDEIPYSSPSSIYERVASTNSFLLESVKGPERIARYSFIGFDPCLMFRIKNGLIEIESSEKMIINSRKPLNILKGMLNSYKQKPFENLPPFQGGLAGILSYDFVQYLERLPRNAVDDLNLPDAHFMIIDKLIAFDHAKNKAWIIVCPGVWDSMEGKGDGRVHRPEQYDEAMEKMLFTRRRIQGATLKKEKMQMVNPASCIRHRASSVVYEMKKEEYMDIVSRAREYIAAGDIFQANLSQRVSAHIGNKNPWNLYGILRSINPSPFAAFMDFGDYQIVSSSPERLLRVREGIIETRPIAGTRPRGRNIKEDELMRAELLLNKKERAEHIMLIDLERNDLGRVSDYGTVGVDELMITEDCSHVIHIVSNVRGNLAEEKDCFDAIKAAFPGGTITGVPKVRCMEIIDDLEPVCRGPYTGSMGYISFSGNMDLNIIIRTFVIRGEMAYVQAGAGIVADSDPEREYYETLKKAEALVKTLELV